MEDTLRHIELIEMYLENRLSPRDRMAFEKRLSEEEELKAEFDLYKMVVAGIKISGEKNLKLKLAEADRELDGGKIINMRDKRPFSFLAAAAGLFVLVTIGAFWFLSRNNDLGKLADKYFEPEKGIPVHMGIKRNGLENAMNNYKTGQIETAKEQIDILRNSNPGNDTLNYFSGVLNYELNDFSAAAADFKKVDPRSVFYEKAQYRSILVSLKKKNKTGSLQLINQYLSQSNFGTYSEKLKVLKSELTPE